MKCSLYGVHPDPPKVGALVAIFEAERMACMKRRNLAMAGDDRLLGPRRRDVYFYADLGTSNHLFMNKDRSYDFFSCDVLKDVDDESRIGWRRRRRR